MGQEAVFLCPNMLTAIGALIVMVDAMNRSVIRSATNLPAGDLPNDDHTDSMDEIWVRAEEDFGLVRPEPRETSIDKPHRDLPILLTRGKRFPCMLECRPRLFSLILLMVIMTFVPTGKMPHGGYVGCMDPRDPPGNRCWHLLTMY